MISDAQFVDELRAKYDVTWPSTEIHNVSARLRNALGGDRVRARAFLVYLAENRIIQKSLAGYFSVIHSDDELRAKVATAAAIGKKTLPPLPHCGQCNPTRRLEDHEGQDLGPCPRCHPIVRLLKAGAA